MRPLFSILPTARITRIASDDVSDYHSMAWLPDGRHGRRKQNIRMRRRSGGSALRAHLLLTSDCEGRIIAGSIRIGGYVMANLSVIRST
jgi:hypothetical protein